MFYPNDITTEILAHFAGYFELAVEAARQRHHYEQIREARPIQEAPDDLAPVSADIAQSYALGAFQPGVHYTPPSWAIRGDAPIPSFHLPSFFPPEVTIPLDRDATHFPRAHGGHPGYTTHAPDPGSVAGVFRQVIGLDDDDLLVLGEYDGKLHFASGADIAIPTLYDASRAITAPITGIASLSSIDDAPRIVAHIADFAAELGETGASETMAVSFEALSGSYLNGQFTDAAPRLEDHLSAHWLETLGRGDEIADETDTGSPEPVALRGDDVDTMVTLKAGGNLLANQANFFEGGLTPAVVAVRGDVHQLDVIAQTNASWDTDTGIEGLAVGDTGLGTTASYNIAHFIAETRDIAGEAAVACPGLFPTSWNVSVVDGDLVSVEWLKQFSFASDQDISVLSTTGATTFATTGENAAINGMNFANLGFYYDLVIIGGTLYDANIVTQTNVLYDNDVIDTLAAKTNTSGNLLWNEATIQNIGPTQFSKDMPAHFSEAMSNLAAGKTDMPTGFATGDTFQGFGALKVLYISGNLYDLRYVEQTNVLGDADFVTAQKSKMLDGLSHTKFTVETGLNSLVNMAHIKDFDSLGKTAFAGGNVYSDAVLIQGDLLGQGQAGPNGGLVSEVVAFLDSDHGVDLGHFDGFSHMMTAMDGPAADILQSVLA